MTTQPINTPCHPGFWRRLFAIFYDTFLLAALLFISTALALPLNAGEAFAADPLYLGYLIGVCFLFFGWFWTHGGQTLGLRAWKIQILTATKQPLSWKDALSRFIWATLSWGLFGLGFIWILFDKEKKSLHDRLSGTQAFITTDD
ncbi:MAG TPA: RDD family protein [Methylococcaceae bacterium]|nr:RDD family protein [Methylococcaceae bacterium]HIL39870.1 RDD family protein [Methylococcales bacterium]